MLRSYYQHFLCSSATCPTHLTLLLLSLVVRNILVSQTSPKSSLVLPLNVLRKDLHLELFLNMVYENFLFKNDRIKRDK
jgi:hypothetical protein